MRQVKSVGMLRRLAEFLGLADNRKHLSIQECMNKLKEMDQQVETMEQVTMAWTAADLTNDQKREMGLAGDD